MEGDTDIAAIGALVADRARARILLALGDGRALPASVLSDEAGIAPSTASAHLSKLLRGGLVQVERHGRHRYFRLAGPQVAELIEALARLSPPAPVRSLKQGTRAHAVRYARTCYDHLAGVLGTELMSAMLERGLLTADGDYRLTDKGLHELREFGIDLESLQGRRPRIRYCVDWSEQRHPQAGALGAALAERMFELGWVRRTRHGRAVHITEDGFRGFRAQFGLELAAG
jgi:DNA-binding transcriptional ArsR family regulator